MYLFTAVDQYDGIRRRAHNGVGHELEFLAVLALQHMQASCRCIQVFDAQRLLGRGLPAVDGDEGQRLVGISRIVDVQVSHALCLVSVTEDANDVVGIVSDDVVQLHTGYHGHGDVIALQRIADGPFRRVAAYLDMYGQRFVQSVLRHQVNHLVVIAHVDERRYVQRDGLLVGGRDGAAGSRHGNPLRQVLDVVRVLLAAQVGNGDVDVGALSVSRLHVEPPGAPA